MSVEVPNEGTVTLAEATAALAARSLRVPQSEVQLTKALAVLMLDERLATKMVRGLLASLPHDRQPKIRLPRTVDVKPEAPTVDTHRRLLRVEDVKGKIDWRLVDKTDSSRFQLLVEVKIASKLREGQLEKYLGHKDLAEAEWGRVIALTRDSEVVPPEVDQHPRWLGVVRWRDLIPRLRLEEDDIQTPEGLIWNALLDQAERRGDLGVTYPDWQDLRLARSESAELLRGQVARRVIDELLPEICKKAESARLVSTRTGSRAWLAIGSSPSYRALRIELHGSGDVRVSARAYPPERPIRKGRHWDQAIARCIDAGWRVERHHLELGDISLETNMRMPHEAAVDLLRGPLAPLLADVLLPRVGSRRRVLFASHEDLAHAASPRRARRA